ncbi:MAG: hypothetical protein V3T70_06010 [Phycisphaerae bacterium]
MKSDDGQLLRLLNEQLRCYRQLRRLADRQRLLVREDEPQALLTVLGERQQLVNELTALNGSLAPFRESWTDVYRGLPGDHRRDVQAVLEETNALLASIMQADRQDAQALSARRLAAATQITQAADTGRAAAAYARQSGSAAPGAALTEARA